MALNPGTRIGHYEVVGAIGSGGMGEVYRARDTKLGREVALKVLPDGFAHDADRMARFKREAHVLASLNHPHIAQIHGIEESGPVRAIVMELVEGRTLAELIAGESRANQIAGKSPGLGLPDALAIARQIAEALVTAHELGIIHRDLKPANIKITDDGTVKVLDFGLAKPTGDDANRGGSNVANSPTLTSPAATALGLILGTAAYMAPEQAKGQRVDKRADVWAFGCVLYEMLSGRRAFEGDDVSDVLASVLKTDPDWRALPADLPHAIRLLVERALVKDRRRRVGDISTALFLLNEAAVLAPPSTPAAPRRATGWLVAGAAVCLLAGAALATIAFRTFGRSAVPAPQRLSLALPPDRGVALGWFPGSSLAISPDGTEVVYVSANPGTPLERSSQLRIRSLASLAIRDLPGTFLARQPFFSPDGQSVAFFTTNGELKKIALSGGSPVTLVDKINGSAWTFGVWTATDTIVFGGAGTAGLKRVPADGGSPTTLTSLDVAQGESGHYPGSYAPEAGAVVFTTAFSQLRDTRLEAVILQSGERRVITENAGSGRYLSTGHLAFRRGDAVLVAQFDVKRLALAGPAAALSDDVRRDGANSEGSIPQLAVSSNGTLAYVRRGDTNALVMGRTGRAGGFTPFDLAAGPNRRPRVSPDGQRVMFESIGSGGATVYETTVHVHDLLRGTVTRLTETGSESNAVWRPDGKGVALYARRPDVSGIYLKDLGGQERLVLRNDDARAALRPESFSPDGAVLAYTRQQGSQYSIWLLTLGEKPVARPLTSAAASEHSPKFSPDGRWLAYVGGQFDQPELYVRGYPSGEPIAVSASGGVGPVWSRDGRALFYESPQLRERTLMSVPVSMDGGTLKLGAPSRVVSLAPAGGQEYGQSGNWGPEYDVFPDGTFAMLRGPGPGNVREIVLVQHWFEELKRLTSAR
jgi:eukaryotic-like serine/threonine-protein kinase